MTLINLYIDNNYDRYETTDNQPSLLSNIAASVNYFKDVIFNAFSERPYLASTLVVASAIPLSLQIYSLFRSRPLEERISSFIEHYCSASERDKMISLKQFTIKYLYLLDKNTVEFENETVHFLQEKIDPICDIPGTIELRTHIIRNILTNFENIINEILSRFERDAANGNLEDLGVFGKDRIKSITVLGDETHNKGRVPIYSITTKNSQFVYKPRSMLPEHLLCGHKESIYEAMGWPTYKIICCKDESGPYGYCEFLTNIEEENIFDSISDLQEYFHKLVIIDELIVKKIGVADLHYLNIATSKKTPFVIDAECFLNPPDAQISMFDPERGAAWVYDLSYEGNIKQKGKNRIWLADNLISNLPALEKRDLPYRFPKTLFNNLKNTFSIPTSFESEIIEQRTQFLQNALADTQPRYILCSTQELLSFMQETTPGDNLRLTQMMEAITESAKEAGFHEVPSSSRASILVRLKEDVSNNDLPIFYYNHTEQAVYYHGTVIARKMLENDIPQAHTDSKQEANT